MKLRPLIHSLLAFAITLGGFAAGAAALEGNTVSITYSLLREDGGYLTRSITETRFGLGNMRVVVDESTPPTIGYQVDLAGPIYLTIEYTTNEQGEIIEGPVELTDYYLRQTFQTKVSGGNIDLEGEPNPNGASIFTELQTFLWEKGTGTLTIDGTCGELPNTSYITWDPQSWQGQNDCTGLGLVIPGGGPTDNCFSTCLPGEQAGVTLCTLAQPAGGWPRLEPLVPDPLDKKDLPLMRVLTNEVFADVVHGDNCTPLEPVPEPPPSYTGMVDPKTQEPIPTPSSDFQPIFEEIDDLKENDDDQAVTYATWYAAETSRVVPEPGAALLAGGALLALGAMRRRGRRR